MSQVHEKLSSPRFVNLCLANLLVHAFLFAQFRLFAAWCTQWPGCWKLLAYDVLAFALGMIVPGPFVAHILELYKRKLLYLKALAVFTLAMLVAPLSSSFGVLLPSAAFAVAGMAYGVMQIALGSTIINDIVISAKRTKADSLFTWAGRMGIPLGLLAGMLRTGDTPFLTDFWWCALPAALAYLLVAQTVIPVKAPVQVSVLSLDRFFLPSSWPAMLAQLPVAFCLGAMAEELTGLEPCMALVAGYALALLMQLCMPSRRYHYTRICLGYALLATALALRALCAADATLQTVATGLAGCGIATAGAEMFIHFVDHTEHCQRGTAQNTHALASALGFALGYACLCWLE